ncbi:hypothetical protein RhiirA4_509646 [Rhizophagus irregularis]|uniref:Ion transport domain-containing protein n=1 Tax=Rhizophagus irregularis TaxID=588596 RepID=A0A2I1HEM4_9GLOM|nr:hypothetical protein RhiirA4_509646 [Rhizophagus irregularis]
MDEEQTKIQENTLAIEIQNETLLEKKDDIFNNIKEHKEGIVNHKKSIYSIFVPHYMDDTHIYNAKYGPIHDDYIVTYSYNDNSFLGWLVNNEENGPQQPDVYYKPDRPEVFVNSSSYVLCKKILSLRTFSENLKFNWLIDLSGKRFLKLKNPIGIGFLFNGDLIQVSPNNRKIYKYSLKDMPKNTDPWEYSQIYDIEIPENFYDQFTNMDCFIRQTKLFLIVRKKNRGTLILQFDLFTMNLERHHNSHIEVTYPNEVIMNKNQTLLAIGSSSDIYIFSMENGMLILRLVWPDVPVGFITLKNNSERLVIRRSGEYKLIDPYQTYDESDISDDFNDKNNSDKNNNSGGFCFNYKNNSGGFGFSDKNNSSGFGFNDKNNSDKNNSGGFNNRNKNVITKSNRKIFIDDIDNICVITNWLDENKLQQISDHNSIYTLSTFKFIQSMLNKINEEDINKIASSKEIIIKDVVRTDNDLCQLIIDKNNDLLLRRGIYSYTKYGIPYILSFKLLDDQNLVLIGMRGIYIYTIELTHLTLRYFWYNDEWKNIYSIYRNDHRDDDDTDDADDTDDNDDTDDTDDNDDIENTYDIDFINKNYMPLFKKILNNEFNDSKFSIPLSKFIDGGNSIIEDIAKDKLALSLFGLESLKTAIDKLKYREIEKLAIAIIEDVAGFSKFGLEIFRIAINKKYNNIIRRIIENATGFSKFGLEMLRISINERCNDVVQQIIDKIIKSIKDEHLWIREEIQTISFIVPFQQICVYQDDSKNNDHGNILNNTTTLIQPPNSNTNLFNWFPTSLLAVYKIITGDSGSLSPWTFRENPTMTVLLVAFTFFTVIYLMNLFIGLLNLAIGDYNKEEEFLLQKAQIIMEIELFYMLPWQKHNNKEWFPDWIFYDIPVTEVRKLINAIDNDKTEFNYYLPFISKELRELVVIKDEVRDEKLNELENKTKEELKQQIDEVKQQINEVKQQNQQMRTLLNEIIKGLNIDINNEIKETENVDAIKEE